MTPASVRFTEEMLGHMTFGEEDFLRGAVAEREGAGALKFHLTIVVDDIERFGSDPQRGASALGVLDVAADDHAVGLRKFGDLLACIEVDDFIDVERLVGRSPTENGHVNHGVWTLGGVRE